MSDDVKLHHIFFYKVYFSCFRESTFTSTSVFAAGGVGTALEIDVNYFNFNDGFSIN